MKLYLILVLWVDKKVWPTTPPMLVEYGSLTEDNMTVTIRSHLPKAVRLICSEGYELRVTIALEIPNAGQYQLLPVMEAGYK